MPKQKIILRGIPASAGITEGRAKIILSLSENSKMKKGDILVAPITNPLFTFAIIRASAIVTDLGGVLSHAAIVARELNIPAVVGAKEATKILQDNMLITVDGKRGIVYAKIKSTNR